MFEFSRLARKSLKMMVGALAAQTIAIAVLPIFSRYLAAEDFGRFGVWYGVFAICLMLAGSKLQISIVNERAPEAMIAVVAIALLLSFCVSSLIVASGWAFAPGISHLMASWTFAYTGALALGVWLTVAIQCSNAVAIAQGNFRELVRQRVVVASSVAVCQLVAITIMPTGLSLIVGFVAGSAVGAAYGFAVSLLPLMKEAVSLVTAGRWLKGHWVPLMYMTLAELISTAIQYLPVMILGARFGTEAAGLMTMTIRVLAAPATLICGSLLDVYKHASASEYETNGQCISAYRSTLRLALPLAVAIGLPVFLFAPTLFALALGEQWRVSGEFARLMSVLIFLRVLSNPVSHTLYLAGKAHLELGWQIVLLSLVLLALYLGQSEHMAVLLYAAAYSGMYMLHLMVSHRAAKGSALVPTV